MSAMYRTDEVTRAPRTSPLVGWLMLAGGVLYFVGGSMHPKEDPPGVSLKEHLLVMYEDPAWYPAHAVFFVGMVLLAASLVTLVRGGSLRPVRAAHALAVVAAVTTTLAAAGSLLHLVSAPRPTGSLPTAAHRSPTHRSSWRPSPFPPSALASRPSPWSER